MPVGGAVTHRVIVTARVTVRVRVTGDNKLFKIFG